MNSVLQPAPNPAAASSQSKPAEGESSPLHEWCAWQARLLPQAEELALFTAGNPGLRNQAQNIDTAASEVTCAATWPTGRPVDGFLPLVSRALAESCALSARLQRSLPGESVACIAIPLPASAPEYVAVVVTRTQDTESVKAIQQLVEWGAYWLKSGQQGSVEIHRRELVSAVMRQESFNIAAQELVNRLAALLHCERVGLGLEQDQGVQLQVLSNTASFDRRMAAVIALESAMDEALGQGGSLSSGVSESRLDQAHTIPGSRTGAAHSVSFPFGTPDQLQGVVTLERNSSLSEAEELWCQSVMTEIAPVLELLHRDSQSLFERGRSLLFQRWTVLTGREHSARQLIAMGAVVVFLLSLILEGPHRVVARASIEGSDRQLITAAHAGYVLEAYARAGDTVAENEIIARLDDRELLVTRSQWESELSKLDKSYAQALANGDRTELSLLRAQRDELQAELKLVEQQLERNVIRSPFAGVLVSGDLNQQLGAPVEAGQTLFEITSLDSYRLLLDVDEHTVADVQAGQSGVLRLASMPDNAYELALLDVLPVAQSREGKTVFRMQAEFIDDDQRLRPGMQGVAKIDVGTSSWLWLWTHRFIQRIRIWLWSVGI